MDSPFIVLDIETTGLSPYMHKITEIAAIKIQNGQVLDSFQTLINPQTPIPGFITRLTGITNDMVKDAPLIKDVLVELKHFIQDNHIVAHNATFDFNFLTHNFSKYLGEPLVNKTICTRKLASRILPHLPSKKLSSLCEYYDVINESAHRAMGDTQATTTIFNKFCEELKSLGCKTSQDLYVFCHAPSYQLTKIKNSWNGE